MYQLFLQIVLAAGVSQEISGKPRLPHIFFVIVDDFGWADVGYHRTAPSEETQTPYIDSLVRNGIELNRHYVHMTCTPSRASFQSGRLPAHVLTQLAGPCDKNGAIPRNMTGIAVVLKRAGYATHQVGKWDCGMATPSHTPKGRGYDTSLNYFSHGNWMYSEREWLGSYNHRADVPVNGFVDFWDTDRPASQLNGTGYEEYIFRNRMLRILNAHNKSQPLFLQYDSKIAHYPMMAPRRYQERFKHVRYDNRRVYLAMINFLDDQLANITGEMQRLGMWENTLMVLSSDNGGYVKDPLGPCNTTDALFPGAGANTDVGHGTVCMNGEAGANNYPLRGGKYSNFEGGIRVNAFVSGGYVPLSMQGKRLEGMIHIADWYRTFAEGIASIDPTDHWAESSGLPPLDSLNMWPMLSGRSSISPREAVGVIFHHNLLVMGRWKYASGGTNMIEAAWGGPQYPNASTAFDPIEHHEFICPVQGCLFDVVSDPSEKHEVSLQHPQVVSRMRDELRRQAAGIWSTTHANDPECKRAASFRYGGFYGPWLEVDTVQMLPKSVAVAYV